MRHEVARYTIVRVIQQDFQCSASLENPGYPILVNIDQVPNFSGIRGLTASLQRVRHGKDKETEEIVYNIFQEGPTKALDTKHSRTT
jgi:hypothetical protein